MLTKMGRRENFICDKCGERTTSGLWLEIEHWEYCDEDEIEQHETIEVCEQCITDALQGEAVTV